MSALEVRTERTKNGLTKRKGSSSFGNREKVGDRSNSYSTRT